MSGRRSQGNHEAVSQLLETAVPPLSPEAVTRKRAEAEAAAAQNKANNAAREQELMELGELHESLVSQLPTRVRAPVKAEKRRAPGAPPQPPLVPRSTAAPPKDPSPRQTPASFVYYPPRSPTQPGHAPSGRRVPRSIAPAAASPRRASASGWHTERGSQEPPVAPWQPAGVQPLSARAHRLPFPPPDWRDDDDDNEFGPAHELPPVTGSNLPLASGRGRRLVRKGRRHSGGKVWMGGERIGRYGGGRQGAPSVATSAAAISAPVAAASSPAELAGGVVGISPPSTSVPPSSAEPSSLNAGPPKAGPPPLGPSVLGVGHARRGSPIPPLALPNVPLPHELNPPSAAELREERNWLLVPPSAAVLRWAREQLEREGRFPRATAFPPTSDRTERAVVERMQRKLLAARRASTEADGAGDDVGSGWSLSARSERPVPGRLDYPSLVYASYNPAFPPEGRAGGPGHATMPRRLLSNRWDSAVMNRTYDVRLSAAPLAGDGEGDGEGGGGAFKLPAVSPRIAVTTPRAMYADVATISSAADVWTLGGPEEVSGLLGVWPAASPAAAAIEYRSQLVADTVDGYERPPRWRVNSPRSQVFEVF